MSQSTTDFRSYFSFGKPVYLICGAATVGKKEYEGPYGAYFDRHFDEDDFGCSSFEEGEAKAVSLTMSALLKKAACDESDIDLLLAGDLLNQCTATGYGLKDFDIPYMGLYGACASFALGIVTACQMMQGGALHRCAIVTSSNYSTAEKQYRFPLEYGAIATPTAQSTVTGCGAVLLSDEPMGTRPLIIPSGILGFVNDNGTSDVSNMGAAMASGAFDTLCRYFSSPDKCPADYDFLITGDLGKVGLAILRDLAPSWDNICDCGDMIYDKEKQKIPCGGSGAGCSAAMFAGYFLKKLQEGDFRRVVLAGTGAMLSKDSIEHHHTIPAVCHLFEVCGE